MSVTCQPAVRLGPSKDAMTEGCLGGYRLLLTDNFKALIPFTDTVKSCFTFYSHLGALFYNLLLMFCSFHLY